MRSAHLLRRIVYACTLLAAAPWLQNCSSSNTGVAGTTGGTAGGSTAGTSGSTGGGTSGTPGGSTGGTTGAPTKSASVAGSVSSQVAASGQISQLLSLLATDTTCNSVAVSLYAVGGGNTPVATGTVTADGNFSITWNVSADPNVVAPEVVLHFDCPTALSTNLRCFGKPGDAGLICDPISNALASALEHSLGQPLESSHDLQGLSVAKIVQGLAETLKLVSRLNPQQDVVADLALATDPNALAQLIASSPVGSLFTSIATIAQQTIVQNQAGNGNDLGAALQAVWTPGKTIELLASLGLSVELNVDDSAQGGPSAYSDLAGAIDAGTASPFMHDTVRYLSDLYAALYVSNQASSVSLLCNAQRFSTTSYVPPLVYPPDATQDSNGLYKLTCLGPRAVNLGVAAVGSNGNNPNNADIGLLVTSSFVEPDRNDPTGTHGSVAGGSIDLSISLVDVFPEFIAGLEPGGACAQYVVLGEGGPGPGTQWAALGNCIHDHNLGQYFAGVLGVYRFLTDTTVTGVKVSLDDVYGALVDRAVMRLTAQGPGIYLPFFGGNVTATTQGGHGDTYFNTPLLLQDANAVVDNGELYRSYCPSYLCDPNNQGAPNTSGSIAFTPQNVNDLLQATRPRYQDITGIFENIPDFTQLRQQIFTSAHHIEYNPSGGQFWSVAGVDPNGLSQALQPILCAFKKAGVVVQGFGPGVTVACEIAAGTWVAGLQIGITPDYSGYFGLAPREGADADRYFALVDRYTGNDYTFNGQTFRIRDVSANSSSGVSADGSTLHAANLQLCNTVQTNGGALTSCWNNAFSYVALDFPNQNVNSSYTNSTSFYPATQYQPFSVMWPIASRDPNNNPGSQWQQVAFASNSNDRSVGDLSHGFPVCLQGNAVTLDANQSWVVISVNLTQGSVARCDALGSSSQAYYFVTLSYGSAATNPNNYNYGLVRNDGQPMQSPNCMPSPQHTCQATVQMTRVEAAAGSVAGPSEAQQYTLGYQLVNLQHDAKFDPYCVVDANTTHCDCYRNGMHLTEQSNPPSSTCTLDDAHGDQKTLGNSPVGNMQGSTSDHFWAVINQAGGQSGQALATQLQQLAQQNSGELSLTAIPVDWFQVFGCASGRTLTGLDLQAAGDPNRANAAGMGCGANNTQGPVTLERIVPRANAYDIARPQTMLKLIATATQDSGTGVALDRTAPVFSFQQALALEFVRLILPFDQVHAEVADFTGTEPNQFVSPPGLQVVPVTVAPPDASDSGSPNLPGAMLRTFLEKAGTLN